MAHSLLIQWLLLVLVIAFVLLQNGVDGQAIIYPFDSDHDIISWYYTWCIKQKYYCFWDWARRACVC